MKKKIVFGLAAFLFAAVTTLSIASVPPVKEDLNPGDEFVCRWATRSVPAGDEAVCIKTGVGYTCTCGDVKIYY